MAEGSVKAADRKRARLEGDLDRLEKSYNRYSSQLEKVEERLARLSGDDAEEEAVREITKEYGSIRESLDRKISRLEEDLRSEEETLEGLREDARCVSVKTFFSRLFLPDSSHLDRSIERSEKRIERHKSKLSRKRQEREALAAEIKRQSEQKAGQITNEQKKCANLAANLRSSLRTTAQEMDNVTQALEALEPKAADGAGEKKDGAAAVAPAPEQPASSSPGQPAEAAPAGSGKDAEIKRLKSKIAEKEQMILNLTESGRGLKDDSAQEILKAVKENKDEISALRSFLDGDDLAKKIEELDKQRIKNSTAPGGDEEARKLMSKMLARLVFDPFNEVTPEYKKEMAVEIENTVNENTTVSVYRLLQILEEKMHLKRGNTSSGGADAGDMAKGTGTEGGAEDGGDNGNENRPPQPPADGQEAGPLDISDGAPTAPPQGGEDAKAHGNASGRGGDKVGKEGGTGDTGGGGRSKGQKLPVEKFVCRLLKRAPTPPHGFKTKLYVTPAEGGEIYLTDENAADFMACDLLCVNEERELKKLCIK